MKKKLVILLGAILLLVACNKNNETIIEIDKETMIETKIETETETETETEMEPEPEPETETETETEKEIETEEDTQSEDDFVNPISDQFTIDDFENKEDYVVYKLRQITGMKDLEALATGNEININGINAQEFQVYEDMSEHIVTYGYYAVDNAGIIYENDIITNQWIEVQ